MPLPLVIVGGGCAGLSLASALGARAIGATVLEPRTEYVRDRTWCFWNVQPHRFERAITHRWSKWAVRCAGKTVVRSAPGLEYVHVDGKRFYDVALESLRASGVVDLRLGASVSSVRAEGDAVDVTTTAGERLRAARVYDTRPPEFSRAPAAGERRLLQHFRGAFVRTARPVFDPTAVTLMDFDVPQDRGLSFVYVLPFSETEALVEATWFTKRVHDAQVYDETLARWRKERLGLDLWEVLETERGVLPMTTEALSSPRGARVQRLGVGGGSAKPSTGYAFLAIQRQVDALAERIVRGEHDAPAARSPAQLAMDRVMLDWMIRHEREAPALFVRLFERVAPATLARFLSEHASSGEGIEVMREVPTMSFLGATLRSGLGSLRSRL